MNIKIFYRYYMDAVWVNINQKIRIYFATNYYDFEKCTYRK